MSDEDAVVQPRPALSVPPPSRLGNILGWSLLALGAACLITALWIAISSHATWSEVQTHFDSTSSACIAHPGWVICAVAQSAYAALLFGRAAYASASLRCFVTASAGCLLLVTVPGLLYARDPSLLGGPLGRVFRWFTQKLQGAPERKHPLTFYQGFGFALIGIALAAYAFVLNGPNIFIDAPIGSAASTVGVLLPGCTGILAIAAFVVSLLLIQGGPWSVRQQPGEGAGE